MRAYFQLQDKFIKVNIYKFNHCPSLNSFNIAPSAAKAVVFANILF